MQLQHVYKVGNYFVKPVLNFGQLPRPTSETGNAMRLWYLVLTLSLFGQSLTDNLWRELFFIERCLVWIGSGFRKRRQFVTLSLGH